MKPLEPDTLFVLTVNVHCQNGHFVQRRKLGEFISDDFEDLGSFQILGGATFAQVKDQNQGQRFAGLPFAREL